MKLIFEYGFTHKGFKYGWFNKELYRLPSKSKNYNYPLKKLNEIKIGNSTGYRIKKDKLSLNQLMGKTKDIKKVSIEILNNKHLPF